jgi:hypothetical protein
MTLDQYIEQEHREELERDSLQAVHAQLRDAALALARDHRLPYYDQMDCWSGEPHHICTCPACVVERLLGTETLTASRP